MDASKFNPATLTAVQDFCGNLLKKYGTQSAAAKVLQISDAHFISFRRADWQNIGEAAFNSVAARAGITDWKLCDTINFQEIGGTLDAAQSRSKMIGLVGQPGAGKTEAARIYCQKTPGAYYMLADAEMSKARFLSDLMREMGMAVPGAGAVIPGQMIEEICQRCISQEQRPLLVIDDAGKLSPTVLRIIQIIYDRTKDRAGIVLIGTPYLKKMMDLKAKVDVMGFRELLRRFAYWITLDGINEADVMKICKANGITDPDAIRYLCTNVADFATLNFLVSEALERAARAEVSVSRDLLVAMQRGRS
jgi:hypothetical protein